jgi:hypothetical protein
MPILSIGSGLFASVAWRVAALALAIRGVLALRPFAVLDNLFVPDDTWYTLAIARSLAHGGPPAVDGLTPTSGFQPLLAFLQVPLIWLVGEDLLLPAQGTIWLAALADAAAAGLLAALGQRSAGPQGWWAGLLWAVSPVAIGNALGGLETSLALALQLAIVLQLARLAAALVPAGPAAKTPLLLLGLTCGLALLARVDSAFVVAGAGLVVWRWYGLAAASQVAAVAALVVATWWGWCTVHLGSPVPESGAAVRAITQIQHTSSWLDLRSIVALAAGTLLPAPVVEGTPVRDALYFGGPLAWLGGLFWLGLVGWGLRQVAGRLPLWVWPLVAQAAAVLLLYVAWVPAVWFFRRYFEPVLAVQALALGCGLAHWQQTRPAQARPVLALCVAVSSLQVGLFAVTTPQTSIDTDWHGAKGYAKPALQILSALPDGAVVGALQSGALAWFANGRVRVVNLDGVVDGEAAAAYKSKRLLQFCKKRGVSHLADWPFNLQFLRQHDAAGPLAKVALQTVHQASPQGPRDAFVLVAVDWTGWPVAQP